MPGDAIAIREALRNLIENAIRHSSPGADIEVTVGPGGSIVVEDSGRVFHLRTLRSCSNLQKGSASSEGAGLGLAIVKQVVESIMARSTSAALCKRWRQDLASVSRASKLHPI